MKIDKNNDDEKMIHHSELSACKEVSTQLLGRQMKLLIFLVGIVTAVVMSGAESMGFGYTLAQFLFPLLFLFLAEQSAKIRYRLIANTLVVIFSLLMGLQVSNLLSLFSFISDQNGLLLSIGISLVVIKILFDKGIEYQRNRTEK